MVVFYTTEKRRLCFISYNESHGMTDTNSGDAWSFANADNDKTLGWLVAQVTCSWCGHSQVSVHQHVVTELECSRCGLMFPLHTTQRQAFCKAGYYRRR